jgi:hypothetical protein
MAMSVNGRAVHADSKFRMPWRLRIWDGPAGAAFILCDQSALNFWGYVRAADGSFLEGARARTDFMRLASEAGNEDQPEHLVELTCGLVPMTKGELAEHGEIFLSSRGTKQRLR